MSRKEIAMRRSLFLAPLVAVVLVSLLAIGRAGLTGAQEEQSLAAHPLVGSWLVSVTLQGQEPGAALPPEVTSLITDFADGNVLVANAGQLPPLPPGSGLFFTEGHGSWVATGEGSAEAIHVSLVLDQTGALSNTNTGSASVEVDATGDAYTGSLTIESTSAIGNVAGVRQATVEATRIQLESAGTPES
jgi:hypothetical protein